VSAKPRSTKRPESRRARWLRRLRHARFRAELWLRNLPPFGHRSRNRRLFFPGCSLSSSDPEVTARVYAHLRARDPEVGLWSACCGRPLRQFVDDAAAVPFQSGLRDIVRREGIAEVITACGNCLEELRHLTRDEASVRVRSLYDVLAEDQWPVGPEATGVTWTVHHPCPARRQPEQAASFERLVDRVGLKRSNPGRAGHPLPCCLVGGKKAERKRARLAGTALLTYCAHCTRAFQKQIRTRHVLQLLFGSPRLWRPVSLLRSFWSYLRLRRLSAGAPRAALSAVPSCSSDASGPGLTGLAPPLDGPGPPAL
jgi:hypothetical protein